MSPPWVESCSAPARRHHVLDRHRDRNDGLALVVDPHGRLGLALRARRRPRASSCRRRPARRRRDAAATARRKGERSPRRPPERGPSTLAGIGQIGADDRAARRERARIEQQPAVAIVDPRARVGRRDEPVQHRADAFGIDGELDRVRRRSAGARRSGLARAAAASPGSTVIVSVSTVAEAAMAAEMMSAWVVRLCVARRDDVGAELVEQQKADRPARPARRG